MQRYCLVIDGAYLTLGSKTLEHNTNKKLMLGRENVQKLDAFISSKLRGALVNKHIITAEMNEGDLNKRRDLYRGFKHNGYAPPDVRDFKIRNVYCPDQQCEYSKGFQTKVQREVDVAIAMRPVQLFMEDPSLTGLVLLAGDGDFIDMVRTVQNDFKKTVYICGWSASMSPKMLEECKPNVIFLDEIWEDLTHVQRYMVPLPHVKF